jgi:methylase of polypeptide subunit release factors
MDVVRSLVRTAALLLRPGGQLVIEHADVQGPDAENRGVVGVLEEATLDADIATLVPGIPGSRTFEKLTDRLDLAGLPRFTLATRTTP